MKRKIVSMLGLVFTSLGYAQAAHDAVLLLWNMIVSRFFIKTKSFRKMYFFVYAFKHLRACMRVHIHEKQMMHITGVQKNNFLSIIFQENDRALSIPFHLTVNSMMRFVYSGFSNRFNPLSFSNAETVGSAVGAVFLIYRVRLFERYCALHAVFPA